MNVKLETPPAVLKAREAKKGMNWFLEILVFGLVYLAVSIGESVLMLPGMVFVMLTNPEVIAAAMTGDTAQWSRRSWGWEVPMP